MFKKKKKKKVNSKLVIIKNLKVKFWRIEASFCYLIIGDTYKAVVTTVWQNRRN